MVLEHYHTPNEILHCFVELGGSLDGHDVQAVSIVFLFSNFCLDRRDQDNREALAERTLSMIPFHSKVGVQDHKLIDSLKEAYVNVAIAGCCWSNSGSYKQR